MPLGKVGWVTRAMRMELKKSKSVSAIITKVITKSYIYIVQFMSSGTDCTGSSDDDSMYSSRTHIILHYEKKNKSEM